MSGANFMRIPDREKTGLTGGAVGCARRLTGISSVPMTEALRKDPQGILRAIKISQFLFKRKLSWATFFQFFEIKKWSKEIILECRFKEGKLGRGRGVRIKFDE